MRIVHVTYGFGMGGIETMLVNISNEQTAAGHDVHIIVINDIVEQSLIGRLDADVTLHLLGRPRGSRNPFYIFRLNSRMLSVRPDVIHLHYSSISRYIFPPHLRRRLCVTLHDLCRPANIVALGRSGPVFAISDMVREDIASKTGIIADTVCNGINMRSVTRRPAGQKPSDPFRIVQVSRLHHEKKGQDVLIPAVASLIAEGRRVHLTLIGEGESRSYLEKLVKDCGIKGSVEFTGNRTQEYVLSHLADYDLFVQPSRFDGFGLTVAEAMAAGVPVLVSDNNAPMEVIGYGSCGFHFRGGDYEDCARKIAEIMDNYPDRQFMDAAVARVDSLYNVRRTARRYLELYETKVINSNHHNNDNDKS